jgi:SAM-dependent methyltransferase
LPNADTWRPSKAELHRGHWRASRDVQQVSRRSRFSADLLIAAYERAIRKHAHGVLADIGCGRAPYFGIYRHHVSTSVGVDWPNSPHARDQVDVLSDLNVVIGLPDESADTILCTDVLEHIFQPAILWRELARIARPGAALIVGVPFLYWLHEQPFDYHRYTEHALRRYAEDAGFEAIEIAPIGGLLHVLIDTVCKGARGNLLRRFAAAMASLTAPVTKRLLPRSTRFPLAYLLIAQKKRGNGE